MLNSTEVSVNKNKNDKNAAFCEVFEIDTLFKTESDVTDTLFTTKKKCENHTLYGRTSPLRLYKGVLPLPTPGS